METISPLILDLAEKNANVRFIADNYDVLCRAHRNKAILVMDGEVVKVFDNEVEAILFTHKAMMRNSDYAIKRCSGPIGDFLFLPNGD